MSDPVRRIGSPAAAALAGILVLLILVCVLAGLGVPWAVIVDVLDVVLGE